MLFGVQISVLFIVVLVGFRRIVLLVGAVLASVSVWFLLGVEIMFLLFVLI